ncbi:hypothetical protein N0V90_008344 [Kalmusia sp. IMI 367209]|nr:hypothetical protein N0V90_008344 [Kalmusia sp. IMI 367209]
MAWYGAQSVRPAAANDPVCWDQQRPCDTLRPRRHRRLKATKDGRTFSLIPTKSKFVVAQKHIVTTENKDLKDHLITTGLAYDTPKTYESNWGKNETEANRYWDSLDASPVVIALTYKEAAEKYGLGPSAPFPWDNEKGLYYIKAFHHLHCLKIIRKAVKSFDHTGTWIGSREHLYHCLNTIRQDIMCKPDDTIMTTGNKPHVIGDDQTVWCRNWDALVHWAQDPYRHACYKIFDDDKPVAHSLELYAYCPVESPHYQTMKAYFEKHGHRTAFGKSYGEA